MLSGRLNSTIVCKPERPYVALSRREPISVLRFPMIVLNAMMLDVSRDSHSEAQFGAHGEDPAFST